MDSQTTHMRPLNVLGKIARYFINQFQMTLLAILIITVLGLTSLWLLPKESLPEIVFPSITVQTLYPSAGALDVEQLITDPIESKLTGLDDLDDISSTSSAGFSRITLTFLESVDIQKKELEVSSLLNEVSLPEGVETPSVFVFKTSEFPVVSYSISGPYGLTTLTSISETIADDLEKLPNVDAVTRVGTTSKEYTITLNPFALYTNQIALDDISRSIRDANINLPVGSFQQGNQNFSVRIDTGFSSLQALEEVRVSKGSATVPLSELGRIEASLSDQTLINRTYLRANGQTETSIYSQVQRKKGADVLGTSQKIQERLLAGKGNLYPSDVSIEIVYDNAINVEKDLANIQLSALSGLIVVILVLFLFIGLKESLIVSVTIPLSLLMTLGLLSYFDISLNTFAILGLIVALGLLVDNSIIVMENMDRLSRLGLSPKEAALQGTNQVALPILASTLTTIAAFFPLAILPGIVGAFINTIPRTIIIALSASLLVSITVTPSIYALILNRKGHREHGPTRHRLNQAFALIFVSILAFYAFYSPEQTWVLPLVAVLIFSGLMALKLFVLKSKALEDSQLVVKYKALITWILAKTRRQVGILSLGLTVLVLSASLIPLGVLKINFFPQNEPTALTVTIDPPGGTSLEETTLLVNRIENILMADASIRIFNAAIGGTEADYAAIDATFIDASEREESGFEILKRIDQAVKVIPGAQINVSGSAGGGPPVGKAISINILADDYEAGKQLAEAYKETLKQIDGVYNVNVSVKDGAPEIQVDLDDLKMKELGITYQSVANTLNMHLEGQTVTTIKEGSKLVDVKLYWQNQDSEPLDQLKSLQVLTLSGQRIPLSEIARFDITQGISQIQHDNTQRIIILDADVQEGFNASDISLLFDESVKDIPIPPRVQISTGGDVEGIQESFLDLFRSMLLAILLVFVILTVQFKSISQPFAILTTIPMALIGVFTGLVLTGNEFGFYAFMGLVALVGIAVNDAIVLIDYMNALRSEGYDLLEAIIEAGKTRFNPVLATTMTTIGGVLPLAFREIYFAQFSYALVFGLLVTTILTLIFIPIVYHLIEKSKLRIQLRKEARNS